VAAVWEITPLCSRYDVGERIVAIPNRLLEIAIYPKVVYFELRFLESFDPNHSVMRMPVGIV